MASLTERPTRTKPRYHRNAYHFVFTALQHAQEKLQRTAAHVVEEEEAHISGPELCLGLRELSHDKFGLLAKTVLEQWGIRSTDDVGRIVFELIERGEMRKTDRDRLSDFADVFDFEHALVDDYRIDTSHAFRGSA
ncbi:Minf_1886 family protein [Stratiformator vulcanicus]|uniref:Uncharacterized protein n=1 Tax=Stratiformator vulcanicus TaxID=2527980 RepID=A0A517QXL1_9PLAN|nr:Minf_1886 family protein [Stratiformator vulcanicus]QDT36392.1 hypothetical protein Pan189_07480 [Stratiformator vulcanicus]